MTKERNEVEAVEDRAAWETPELQRLDPREAEAAANTGTDNVIYS